MGRPRKTEMKPWEKYGLTMSTYYYRVQHNIPLEAPICSGRSGERFSGLSYKNPLEKIEELKRKYAHDITHDILDELLR